MQASSSKKRVPIDIGVILYTKASPHKQCAKRNWLWHGPPFNSTTPAHSNVSLNDVELHRTHRFRILKSLLMLPCTVSPNDNMLFSVFRRLSSKNPVGQKRGHWRLNENEADMIVALRYCLRIGKAFPRSWRTRKWTPLSYVSFISEQWSMKQIEPVVYRNRLTYRQ